MPAFARFFWQSGHNRHASSIICVQKRYFHVKQLQRPVRLYLQLLVNILKLFDSRSTPSTLVLQFVCGLAVAGGLPATQLEDVTVVGSSADSSTAISAAQGVVLEEQLSERPITRMAELLEFIPGMIATQHSGEGKANQYFLRGFNLDHGTDFATFVDAMPVNMRSHGHGQGYSDINFVIPEMVESLSYRKGPYYADVGDFSAAGNAQFRLRRSLDQNQARLVGGENGYARALLAGAPAMAGGRLLLAADVSRYNGPWVLDQELSSFRFLSRFSQGSSENGYHVTLMGYDSEWDSTDQIPQRAVQSGQTSALGFIDPTVGGSTSRYSLSFGVQRPADRGHWSLDGYVIDYDLQLYSNFTYFLDNPTDGDQFEQLDRRQIYGLSTHRHLPVQLGRFDSVLVVGADLRHDAIADVGLFRTQARQRLSTVRRDQVDESSLGAYGELKVPLTDSLRLVTGLRADTYRFDVTSDTAANSGDTHDLIVSPKLGLAWSAMPRLELFANLGRGFHSNDSRGAVITVDPASDDLASTKPVEPLVAADAVDLGAVWRPTDHAQLSLSLWALDLDSELVYVGDAGATESSDASHRHGIELAAYLQPLPWLIADIDYAWSDARFDIDDPADRIPGAVEKVASAGLTVSGLKRWSAGLRIRYLGAAPLIEDNSIRSEPTTVVNLEAGYRIVEGARLEVGVYNLFDSNEADISYFYESRLANESAGVEDVHFHPVEPRQIRARIDWRF